MFSAVYKKRCYDWDVVGSIQQTLPLKNLAKQTCKKRRSFFPRTVSDWNNLNESNPQSLPTRSRNLKTSSRLLIRTKLKCEQTVLGFFGRFYACGRSGPVADSVNIANQDQWKCFFLTLPNKQESLWLCLQEAAQQSTNMNLSGRVYRRLSSSQQT